MISHTQISRPFLRSRVANAAASECMSLLKAQRIAFDALKARGDFEKSKFDNLVSKLFA